MERIIKEIAEFIQKNGLANASVEDHNWTTSSNEIKDALGINYEFIKSHLSEIADYFDYEVVADYEIYDDGSEICFDLDFFMAYVPNEMMDWKEVIIGKEYNANEETEPYTERQKMIDELLTLHKKQRAWQRLVFDEELDMDKINALTDEQLKEILENL